MTSTLSQVGLSIHLARGVKWIRAQGELVSWRGETWAREEFSTGRLHCYRLVARPPKRV